MPKVLVVDDEEHIRMLYEEELKIRGVRSSNCSYRTRNIGFDRKKKNPILSF
ncbi:MAG: hypothetical protein KIIPBIDF_01700 [Candidatus Methanoperedenaceae archaeon GB50]|nr:MAG: hypothetical protein KIIPBIDF_01700 [Candidatus Methanoperedenaceae archaeon GB50]